MSVLVSIHDVTPAHAAAVHELWKLCQQFDVAPALFVVPDWHGAWPLESHLEFVQWVQSCAANGAEIFLHGERHDEVGLPRTMSDSVRAFGKTAREGEFLTLYKSAASERIGRGLVRLRALGLQPIGFVPPAWLAREETFEAVFESGLRVSEDELGIRVHDAAGPERKVRLAAPAVRWSGRTAIRAHASAIVAAWRWKTQRSLPLVRLALHPQDLLHPVSERSVRHEVPRWLSLRNTIRYADV